MRFASGVASLSFVVLLVAGCGGEERKESGAVATATPVDVEPTPVPDNGGLQKAPIVLMHGMAGFEAIGPAEYFYGVADALRDDGYDVLVTVVDPFQSVDVRAAQAKTQIEDFMAQTGALRVHLVGHSQGGLDARFVVASLGLGDRVATVTTIATPHRGIELIDVSTGLIPGDATAALAALSSAFLGTATGTTADLAAQLAGISHQYCHDVFNPENPDDSRVRYFSVSGVTQPWLAVDLFSTDIVDPLLLSAYWLNLALEGENDGLVPLESAKWGEYLGTVPADHLDEMGWFPEIPQPAFDHVAFYRKLGAFLNADGPAPL